MTLYLFNPEHDYALANNDPNFVAPESARRFAKDCDGFMQSFSFSKDKNEDSTINNIETWGWDRAIKRRLIKEGISDNLLPSDESLDNIRRLSHRQTASDAMHFLKSRLACLSLPMPAAKLQTVSEILNFCRDLSIKNKGTIFKAPYSGNGRGIIHIEKEVNTSQIKQLESVLNHQGVILGEPKYDVIQDFAMEFKCKNKSTSFCGYSLFHTNSFSYDHNLLLSDIAIEKRLSHWISLLKLESIKEAIIDYFNTYIAPYYEGYAGVDMFVYSDEKGYRINPMVEINLRYTMGLASRMLYDNNVHPDSYGILKVEYFEDPNELLSYVRHQSESAPLTTKNGYWSSGFITLTKVTDITNYSISISLTH